MPKIDCAACGSPNPIEGRFCVYCSKPLRSVCSQPASQTSNKTSLIIAGAGVVTTIAGLSLVLFFFLPRAGKSVGTTQADPTSQVTNSAVEAVPVEEIRYSFTAPNGKVVTASVTPTKEGRKAVAFSPSLDKATPNIHHASLQALLNIHRKDKLSLASNEPQTERDATLAADVFYWNVDEWRHRFYSLPVVDPKTGKVNSIIVWLDDTHVAVDENTFRTRIAANEESAIEYLHSISIAEMKYSASDLGETYGTIGKLSEGGYLTVRRPLQGYKADLRVKDDFFEAVAVPIKYGTTGVRSFYLSSKDFKVHGADRNGLDATVKDPSVE